MGGGLVLGILALFLSFVSAYMLYRVADASQSELLSVTRASSERIAELNNQTERLKAENLELQRIMQPRRLPTGGGPEFEPKYKDLEQFAGMKAVVFVVPDFGAQLLASDLANVLRNAHWQLEDEPRIDTRAFDGISIYSGIHTEEIPPKPDAAPPDKAWRAGEALARLMAAWGLGHRGMGPMSHHSDDLLPRSGLYDRPDGAVTIRIGLPDIYNQLMMLRHFGPPKTGPDK